MAHTSVFSFPENITLFCAAVGTGNQLLLLTLFQLALGLLSVISAFKHGSILAGVVVLYCPLSLVGGYAAVRLFRQLTGKKDWMNCALITAGLFPTPVAVVFAWTNTVALAYGSSIALPSSTLFACLALYSLVSFPLTMLGGFLAKDTVVVASVRNHMTREISASAPRKRGRPHLSLLAACLPFFSLFTELHSILLHVGPRSLQHVWYSHHTICSASGFNVPLDVLLAPIPARRASAPSVVGNLLQRRHDWSCDLRLFSLLLPAFQWYDWLVAAFVLLWIHSGCVFCFLSHAGKRWIPM